MLSFVPPTIRGEGHLGSGTGDGGDQYTGLDRFGRIIQQTWTDGTTSVDAYGYTYDRNGSRTAKSNLLKGNLDETYSYDTLDRLTSFARVSGRSQTWALDALGNWDMITSDSVTENRTHNGQNQLTKIGSTNLGYDGNGNTTTDQNGRTLIYDAWNRRVERSGAVWV